MDQQLVVVHHSCKTDIAMKEQKASLLKDRRGVFGLTSVQQFFAIVLGLALLAYVIVVIMGTLANSSIVPSSSLSATVANESGWINSSGDRLNQYTVLGFANPVIVAAINGSSGVIINPLNYSVSTDGLLKNSSVSPIKWDSVNVTYTYSYNTQTTNNANTILLNTSSGVSSFFGNVSPVYAILAILVIILVLVVLVRVVSGSTASQSTPQL